MMRAAPPTIACVLALLVFLVPGGPAAGPDTGEDDLASLVAAVRALDLGEGGYRLGAVLTEDQLPADPADYHGDAYPGTIKFSTGDLGIVADEATRLTLAIFQRHEDVVASRIRQQVAHLMDTFGEPTTSAHGKLVYWAYGPEGPIDNATYQAAKDEGALDVLATVKIHSTLSFDDISNDPETEEAGTVYYIITSDRLLKHHVTQP